MTARIRRVDAGDDWRWIFLTHALRLAPRRFSRPITWKDIDANEQAMVQLPPSVETPEPIERLGYFLRLENARVWLRIRQARRCAQSAGNARLRVVQS